MVDVYFHLSWPPSNGAETREYGELRSCGVVQWKRKCIKFTPILLHSGRKEYFTEERGTTR